MINTNKILNDLIKKLNPIDSSDIPSIDLYMDQVTTFMDKHLSNTRRFAEDKILTKTMINNYSKNNLLPPPTKKRYSKNHIILLIYIYYCKSILPISDISTILEPLCDAFFDDHGCCTLEEIYQEFCQIENDLVDDIKEDIEKKIDISNQHFNDVDDEDREFLQLYSLITSLCFDVYVKKQMLEGIIDQINTKKPSNKSKK